MTARWSDRRAAGRELGDALAGRGLRDAVVLALPRGGVPVGFEIARRLQAPLEVLIVRKIGAPFFPELGIGAVVDGGGRHAVLNEDVIAQLRVDRPYIEAETARQLLEIERRRRVYVGDRAPIAVAGRCALVVDDGVATGGTVRAALRALRSAGAARLALAVPVGPPATIAELAREVDVMVCLEAPEDFRAVGGYFADFTQTTDDEVVALLSAARDKTNEGENDAT